MATDAEVAAKCIEDPAYAELFLFDSTENPLVRKALLDDLAEATEAAGFLNPQPIPPGKPAYMYEQPYQNYSAVQPTWGMTNFTRTQDFTAPEYGF